MKKIVPLQTWITFFIHRFNCIIIYISYKKFSGVINVMIIKGSKVFVEDVHVNDITDNPLGSTSCSSNGAIW